MRLSVVLLIAALLGVVAGAWLVGRWAVGVAIIFDSLCVGVYALARDDGAAVAAPVAGIPGTLEEILDRARGAA